MKVGDLVICRGELYGIILGVDDSDLEAEGYYWAQIMWHDGRVTWEDLIASSEDDVFQVIALNACKDKP